MKNLHAHENNKYQWSTKILIPLGEMDEILMIFRGDSGAKIRQFEIILCTEIDGSMADIRRHCWMPYHKDFHTHVLTKLSGRNKRVVLQTPLTTTSLEKAKEWAKKDMMSNWHKYKRNFINRTKYNTIGKKK